MPSSITPAPGPINLFAPVFDYDGNLCADPDQAILSIKNPVGVGTTLNSEGQVVPNPIQFTPSSNPFVSNALIPPGKKSPYISPPTLVGVSSSQVGSDISVGSAATHRLSPENPVIVKTSMRTEFDDSTNTVKTKTLVVGINTEGEVVFSEETESNNLTFNNNLVGNVTGDVYSGIVTATNSFNGNLTGNVSAGIVTSTGGLSNGTNTITFSTSVVNSVTFLTISVAGVGATSFRLA